MNDEKSRDRILIMLNPVSLYYLNNVLYTIKELLIII